MSRLQRQIFNKQSIMLPCTPNTEKKGCFEIRHWKEMGELELDIELETLP